MHHNAGYRYGLSWWGLVGTVVIVIGISMLLRDR